MASPRLTEFVAEFVPLNRRRVGGDPPLTVLELDRWRELRELLSWELGYKLPVRVEVERALRVPSHLKVTYDAQGEQSASFSNLAEGGVFIESDHRLPATTPLRLSIDPGAGEAPIVADAAVVWTREFSNLDGPAGFGVRFLELGSEETAAIGRLMDRLLHELAQS